MRGLLVVGWLLTGVGVAQVPAAPVVHAAYPAGVGTALGEQVAGLVADPGASRAHWGIAVTAMDGTPIYGRSEGKLFRPASNAKLFTTAAAMALLPDFSTVTTIARFEAPANGISKHGIGLYSMVDARCHADYSVPLTPVFNGEYGSANDQGEGASHPDSLNFIDELAQKIAAQGVTHLEGDIVWRDWQWFDRYPQGWGIEDMAWGYGAPVTSIAVNDNQLKLTLAPQVGVPDASLVPEVGYYQFAARARDVNETPDATDVDVETAAGSRELQITGHLQVHRDSPGSTPGGPAYVTQIAIADPAEFASQALKMKLMQRGLEVAGEARSEHAGRATVDFSAESHKPLVLPSQLLPRAVYPCVGSSSGRGRNDTSPVYTEVSQTVRTSRDEDVAFTLKHSQNLHAELLLRRLGNEITQYDSTVEGSRVVRQWLVNAGLSGEDFFFYDGSGLSVKDLVTPRATAQLLAYAAKQPWFATWKAALPVSGVDGTLGARFKDGPLKGKVFAKTGTLGESRALSGYVECASGKTVIFSVMADDHAPSGSSDRAVMDKIVAAIAESQ